MPAARTVPVGQLAYAIREVESGGISPESKRYTVINSIGATGAYQVMKANIASWTKEALGKSLSLDEWLGNKAAQDKVAMYKLGQYQKKYNSWESAAAVWFSGQPNPDSRASDGGNTVRQYVNKVGKALNAGKTLGDPDDVVAAGFFGDFGDGLLGGLADMARPLADIGKAMLSVGQVADFLLKLMLPSTWVRIVCGILGAGFLIFGLVVLGREARGT